MLSIEPLVNHILRMIMAGAVAVSSQAVGVPKAKPKPAKEPTPIVAVTDLKASTISVSTIKVTWTAEKDRG